MPLIKPTVVGANMLAIVGELRKRKLDPTPLLQSMGWTEKKLNTPLRRIPLEDAATFMERANELAQDPAMHIYAAAFAPLGTYHVADYFTMFAPTIGHGYNMTMTNAHLINSALRCHFTRSPEDIVVTLTNPAGEASLKMEAEVILPALGLRTYWLAGASVPSPTLYFGRPLPADQDQLARDLKCKIELVPGELDRISIPRQTWDTPSIYANQTMHEILDRLVVRGISKRENTLAFLGRVEAAISVTMPQRSNIRAVAHVLYMSTRTLQRRLDQIQIKFRQLVANTRHRHAAKMLQDPDQGLMQIAERLGYADASSFGRAFRKATGHTPSQFRALPSSEQINIENQLQFQQTQDDPPEA